MHKKPLSECTAAERDSRWRDSHESMRAEHKERLISDGKTPREAEATAQRMQERATTSARRKSEGGQ